MGRMDGEICRETRGGRSIIILSGDECEVQRDKSDTIALFLP